MLLGTELSKIYMKSIKECCDATVNAKENTGWSPWYDQNDCNHLQFHCLQNGCFQDRYQVCKRTHSVTIFKATLMHEESNKTAMRQSVCLQLDPFVINQQKLQTRGCELLYIYMEILIHTFRV